MANTQHMPLTKTSLTKLALIFASLLCFSLYLWFAVIQLYLPFLPATDLFAYNYFYISPLPALILPALGGVLYLQYGRPEKPETTVPFYRNSPDRHYRILPPGHQYTAEPLFSWNTISCTPLPLSPRPPENQLYPDTQNILRHLCRNLPRIRHLYSDILRCSKNRRIRRLSPRRRNLALHRHNILPSPPHPRLWIHLPSRLLQSSQISTGITKFTRCRLIDSDQLFFLWKFFSLPPEKNSLNRIDLQKNFS